MLRTRFLFEIVAPALILSWAATLIYSAAFGETGYGALAALNVEREEKQAAFDALQARRMALEKRADLLSSKSLDPDLVDERIRSVLGYSRKGDVVVSREEIARALKARSER